VSQCGLDPTKIIFIDETWARTNMTRLRGRAPVGERLVAKVPHGHWKTTTVIAALDHRGMRCAMSLDGPVNQEAFEAFVEKVLAPKLTAGDIVVLDNLSSHKGTRVRQRMAAAGATVLFLPPYSPDLNPIELAFSKLKSLMRSAMDRTMESLWGNLQSMLEKITASDATNFMRHCGYAT
jgi:transposase